MGNFKLKDSDEYYLCLSDQPERFDADSPATNVFFDDTNGQVFSVRSGGVTGVTVSSMDKTKSTSFRMEDRGSIISIKFSPDQNILAIQRNQDNQNATVEFVNFKDLAPTNVEYSHTCKWKNAKMLGFVWPKVNEIAYITDHGIELLQVLPEKKQLKSLKNVIFSGAWFSWCAQSSTVLLAGNNGILLQPFTLNNSTITKLQKLELESSRPAAERDVLVLHTRGAAWCAVFRHSPATTEVWLMPIGGPSSQQVSHVLQTGLSGRFAVSVVDDLVVVHHQSSQTSQVFDISESVPADSNPVMHAPAAAGLSLRPASVNGQPCPMYSGTWVVFQPDYVIDARLGCLWRVQLLPSGLAACIPKSEIAKTVALLLRRTDGKSTVYRILTQMVSQADTYLAELSDVFDEINAFHIRSAGNELPHHAGPLLSQTDVCARVLQPAEDDPYIVQANSFDPVRGSSSGLRRRVIPSRALKKILVQDRNCWPKAKENNMTSYVWALSRAGAPVQACTAQLVTRALVRAGAVGRLVSLARRGALGESRVLACALLSLHHLHPAAAQLALDMMTRLGAYQDIIEVLLSWGAAVAAGGAARAHGAWGGLPARKLLAAAADARAFVSLYHALRARNERLRGSPDFIKGENCDSYIELYKQIMEE